ncbi:MAG: hypothetical protein ACREGR_01805 [Minisyncoccia bacterium]
MKRALAQTFYFESVELEPAHGYVRYRYTTDVGHVFIHELTFAPVAKAKKEDLMAAAFALGMAELAHYWKAILAPQIIIKAGALDEAQIAFWTNLYEQGLGEFFYVNQLDFLDLIHIESDPKASAISPTPPSAAARTLVPFGGGKDSLVTGELLKAQGKDYAWFELEPLPFGKKLREISGVTECISMGRDVIKNFAPIMELVRQGAPNGHVPITATYIMSAALAAELYDFRDIIVSLERSADEGNVEYLGRTINHQYSKTFEFESAAQAYLTRYVDPNLRVFSLLRPLYELQIIREFAKYPEYFPYFISCNRGLKRGTWCGECAKCAFMFAALSAFLPPETAVGIFHKNLFEYEGLLPLYTELIGRGEIKPFDCVGTFDENLLALYLAGKRYATAGLSLPFILKSLPIEKGAAHEALLEERGPSLIPVDYKAP